MQTNYATPVDQRPEKQLPTDRSLLKHILLTIVTLGIYGIINFAKIGNDVNTIASHHDGKKTMHYCIIAFLLSGITFGIAPLVWWLKLSKRIGTELAYRGIAYKFGPGTYWGWAFFGSIIIVGPFVYTAKLFDAMNLLSQHYNLNG